MKWYGRAFHSSTQQNGEFAGAKEQLKKRKISFEVRKDKTGTTLWLLVPETELDKLPKDGWGPYFPTSATGGLPFQQISPNGKELVESV